MPLFHSEDWTLSKWAIAGPRPSNPATWVSTVRKYSSAIYVVGRMWIKKTTKLVSCVQELDSRSGDENTNRRSLRGPWRSLNWTSGSNEKNIGSRGQGDGLAGKGFTTEAWTLVGARHSCKCWIKCNRHAQEAETGVSRAHLTTTFAHIHATHASAHGNIPHTYTCKRDQWLYKIVCKSRACMVSHTPVCLCIHSGTLVWSVSRFLNLYVIEQRSWDDVGEWNVLCNSPWRLR